MNLNKSAARRGAIHGAIIILAAALAACGGGGSDGGTAGAGNNTSNGTSNNGGNGSNGGNGGVTDPGTTSSKIAGVAAVGAPLVGTVTVKDAKGVTRTVPIGSNGSYEVDVSGMTAPFVFRAEGTANGTTAVVHSIATAADVNGRINVTQLTDLIVANIAGELAQNYFDSFDQGSNTALASPTLIAAEVAKLKEKLLPVLSALGVDAAIDLLHSSFTPLSDPIDKALDVIRVSFDTTANTALISNILNGVTVSDSLATKAADEAGTTTLSSDNVATGATDAQLVRQALDNFMAKFKTGLPQASQLTPLMTGGFRWIDMDRATAAAMLAGNSDFVGATAADVEISQIDYSNAPTQVTAYLSFTLRTAQGVELGRLYNWRIRKTTGDWLLHGDQRVLDLEWFAVTTQHTNMNGSGTACYKTGLEFNIEDTDTTNNGGVISYVMVSGPGLPQSGVKYNAPQLGGRYMIANAGIETYVLASNCTGDAPSALTDSQIAAIPDNAQYTLTAYDNVGTKVSFPTGTSDGSYRFRIDRRPLTLAEAAGGQAFPKIAQSSVDAFNSMTLTAGGTIAFSASNLNPLTQAYVQLRRSDIEYGQIDGVEQAVSPNASGVATTSLSVDPNPNVARQAMWVESPDKYRRSLQSYVYR